MVAPHAVVETERFDALAARIERLATEPARAAASVGFVARPWLRLFGYRARFRTHELDRLFDALARGGGAPEAVLGRAVLEAETNVRRAERACVARGAAAPGDVAWLGRVALVLARTAAVLRQGDEGGVARALSCLDRGMLAPPLAIAAPNPDDPDADASVRTRLAEPHEARTLELALATIDRVIDTARDETNLLDRRRRLLEVARRLLLDAAAAWPLDAAGVERRKLYLAEQIVWVNRLEAIGLDLRVALVHQARGALARGERERLHAALAAIEATAVGAGDLGRAGCAARALTALERGPGMTPAASLARSARELFGGDVCDAVPRAYRGAHKRLAARTKKLASSDAEELAPLLAYFAAEHADALAAALASVDGCFDVGAPLAPVRSHEIERVTRVVSHPTSELLLTRARTPEDVLAAEITDPRSVIFDLATGHLLARKFVAHEERTLERTRLRGEVRIYLLDGSSSMRDEGRDMARARMRDAILAAELATLMRRFAEPERYVRVVLYYRYFNQTLGAVQRVDSEASARTALAAILSEEMGGGTDIEGALRGSFATIREAQAADADLSHAHLVLVTDGQARVAAEIVERERALFGALPIGVSVIALGAENAALRQIVASERARGERAFYHFLDDDTLASLCRGGLAGGRALHPLAGAGAAPAIDAAAVGALLDEAADRDRRRRLALVSDDPQALAAAHAELGLPPPTRSEGQRARCEAAERDRQALARRYARWFPRATEPPDAGARPPIAADAEAAAIALIATSEIVRELGGDRASREADAIDLVERLLVDAGLSPARYFGALADARDSVARALAAVHAAVEGDVTNA